MASGLVGMEDPYHKQRVSSGRSHHNTTLVTKRWLPSVSPLHRVGFNHFHHSAFEPSGAGCDPLAIVLLHDVRRIAD